MPQAFFFYIYNKLDQGVIMTITQILQCNPFFLIKHIFFSLLAFFPWLAKKHYDNMTCCGWKNSKRRSWLHWDMKKIKLFTRKTKKITPAKNCHPTRKKPTLNWISNFNKFLHFSCCIAATFRHPHLVVIYVKLAS